MSKPEAPTPPNPLATAAATTSTNVQTAIANSMLNNVNQYTPEGSLRYDVTGNYGWTDPSTGQTYNIPTFTSTQQLSESGRNIKSQTDATKMNLAGMANAQSARVSNLLGTPFNPSGGPEAGDASKITGVPQASTSFDQGGDITKTYGPADNFGADRQRIEEGLMARMNPQLQIEQNRLQQQLADQGIKYGSTAYTNAMDNYNRQSNDARFAAISQGGQEQQRMMDMASQQAAFQNTAQGQQFNQNAAQAAFGNAGLAQQLAQQQAGFNASQAGRNQWLQEQYTGRNQPLNEITGLLSGSQINAPNFINSPGSQVANTDFAGIANQGFQNQMGNYNAQNQNYQQTMGGVLGLGAGLLGALSDEREKENITKMGTVFAAGSDGEREKLPIYEYSYKQDPSSTPHIGPMAQEVEQITPEAVTEHEGRKYIKPDMVMGSILRAA